MSTPKMMLSGFQWDARYDLAGVENVITPALVVYPDVIASNIKSTIRLLDGEPDRWRVHIKTAKLPYTLGMLMGLGLRNLKCATTLELQMACRAGAMDVLVAYPMMGANALRVREIAEQFPDRRISVLLEDAAQITQWKGSTVGIFIDINPGMNRTGIEQHREDKVISLVRTIEASRLDFRGLHYYDGQYASINESDRSVAAHTGYDSLLELVSRIESHGIHVREVVTAGTPTLPCSLSYQRFRGAKFIHRVSPGTVVYGDATSLAQLPSEYGYAPAVLVLTRVVSHPCEGMATCDAGHKAVSADAGVPTCLVVGHPELMPLSPSEEHLPLRSETGQVPSLGEDLFLLPRHVCPTVNNFDSALIVRNGRLESLEQISARGHEAPLLGTTAAS